MALWHTMMVYRLVDFSVNITITWMGRYSLSCYPACCSKKKNPKKREENKTKILETSIEQIWNGKSGKKMLALDTYTHAGYGDIAIFKALSTYFRLLVSFCCLCSPTQITMILMWNAHTIYATDPPNFILLCVCVCVEPVQPLLHHSWLRLLTLWSKYAWEAMPLCHCHLLLHATLASFSRYTNKYTYIKAAPTFNYKKLLKIVVNLTNWFEILPRFGYHWYSNRYVCHLNSNFQNVSVWLLYRNVFNSKASTAELHAIICSVKVKPQHKYSTLLHKKNVAITNCLWQCSKTDFFLKKGSYLFSSPSNSHSNLRYHFIAIGACIYLYFV